MFTVHREEHRTGYTCIANELIHDRRMSLNARALMILVLSLPKGWDFTVRGLAKMCGMSEKTVFRYFEELKRLGYLRCAKEKGGDGRYLERNYIFYESSVSPQDIIPADTAPPAENDRQYSNNININNKSDKEKKNPAEKAEKYQRILELFCSICVSLPPVTELTVQRYHLLEQAERQTEDFAELFRRIESSDFLTGRNGKWNGCTLDWLLRPNISQLTNLIGEFEQYSFRRGVEEIMNYKFGKKCILCDCHLGHNALIDFHDMPASAQDIPSKQEIVEEKPMEVYTSGYTAALYAKKEKLENVYIFGSDNLIGEFTGCGVNVVQDEKKADNLIIGYNPDFNYEDLTKALNVALKAKMIISCNTERKFPGKDARLMPGCGAMVAALEHCSGKKSDYVIGKPNTLMLDMLCELYHFSNDDLLMVGDTYESDIIMANRKGIRSVLISSAIYDDTVSIANIAELKNLFLNNHAYK